MKKIKVEDQFENNSQHSINSVNSVHGGGIANYRLIDQIINVEFFYGKPIPNCNNLKQFQLKKESNVPQKKWLLVCQNQKQIHMHVELNYKKMEQYLSMYYTCPVQVDGKYCETMLGSVFIFDAKDNLINLQVAPTVLISTCCMCFQKADIQTKQVKEQYKNQSKDNNFVVEEVESENFLKKRLIDLKNNLSNSQKKMKLNPDEVSLE